MVFVFFFNDYTQTIALKTKELTMLEANLYISKAHASVSTGRKPVLLFILFVFKSTKFFLPIFYVDEFYPKIIIQCSFWNRITGRIGRSGGPDSARGPPVDAHCSRQWNSGSVKNLVL